MLQMPVRDLGAEDVGCIASLVAVLCLGLRTITESEESRTNLRSALHSALTVTVIHVPDH